MSSSAAEPTSPPTTEPSELVQKIQREATAQYHPPEANIHPGVPQGEMMHGTFSGSLIYPGTDNDYDVYVPSQYDPKKPACVLIRLDYFGSGEGKVLDNLIAQKEIPVMIGIGVHPGSIWADPAGSQKRRAFRSDRSYEFDSVNEHFPDFLLTELLPAIEKMKTTDGREIHLSHDRNDRAVAGVSTGGIGSFTLAWRRPDQFSRVYSIIGTFVSMRGGHDYPALIRKTEPKPLRIFLEDGNIDAWNPLFGSWFDANVNMASALEFAGYDVAHAWGVHGHNGVAGAAIFPDVLRWLWRDYPESIATGVSQNSTLKAILPDNGGWQTLSGAPADATALAANTAGDVFLADPTAATIDRVEVNGTLTPRFEHLSGVTAFSFGPDGTLYGAEPGEKKIFMFDKPGHMQTVADGIAARHITVASDGTLDVTEAATHSDEPSRIWQIKANGQKRMIDEGLSSASGLAFSPDHKLLFVAEHSTQWIYSYIVQPDGTLSDKQPFYWLHMTDVPNDSGAEDIAVDARGDLYVATRMGVQVCDQNGRVRAILPLPTPCGPVLSLCFGGEHFDTLYATDGKHVFKRVLKTRGVFPSAISTTYPSEGGS